MISRKERYTAAEIELAIAEAVKDHDLGAAISLTKMLATVDPDRAQAVSDIFHTVAQGAVNASTPESPDTEAAAERAGCAICRYEDLVREHGAVMADAIFHHEGKVKWPSDNG